MQNDKYILLIAGRSGSGKSTFADKLSDLNGWSVLQSYTTRSPRFEGEQGHVFVSPEEFKKLPDKCAFTVFNGNRYCATSQQVDENDIYIIDPQGIVFFMENYRGKKKPFVIVVECNEEVALKRMMNRPGGDEKKARDRVKHDKKVFEELTDSLIESNIPFMRVFNDDDNMDELIAAVAFVSQELKSTGIMP